MVRSTHLTPEYIVKAIKAGDCYASSGVTLADVRFDKIRRVLELKIAPDKGATYMTQFIGTLQAADTTGQPNLDKEGKPPTDTKGKALRVSQKYSDHIGQILATSTDLAPRYQLTGKELYVRALVISSLPPADPSLKDQKQQAWTQPVGWESLIEPASASPR
jgi:hypothetical protein